jgi:hypothetical protein
MDAATASMSGRGLVCQECSLAEASGGFAALLERRLANPRLPSTDLPAADPPPSPRAIKIASAVVAALALALLVWGGWPLSVALLNLSPTPTTCADLAAHGAPAAYVRVTDCRMSFDVSVLRTYTVIRVPSVAWVPLRPTGTEGGRIDVLLQTNDDVVVATAAALTRQGGDFVLPTSAPTVDPTIDRQVDIVGIVVEPDGDTMDAIVSLSGVAPDVIVIRQGDSPDWFWPIVRLIGGLIVLLFAFALFASRKTPSAS